MTDRTGPLAGVRVIDLSRLLPGAFCTHMLREMGATVTKIEPPGGDPLRRLAPIAADGNSVFHHLLNQGKESVVLDLRAETDRARLDAMLGEADVVVDNFRAATAKRLGLDRDAIRAAWPTLIHCSITGYGQDGPNANRAGHDLNFVAEAGLLSYDVTGRAAPALPRMFIADVGGGAMSAVIGILAALVARGRSAGAEAPACIDISMHHASLYWLMLPAARLLVKDVAADAPDLPTDGSFACYNVYECGDGKWLALGALEQHFWARFAERIGHAEWAPRQYDAAAQPGIIEAVRALMRTRTRDEWVAEFAGDDICVSPVRDPREALAAAAILASGGALPAPWRPPGR
ncbi:MAG TPA: CaiB/BaiF CoA-transferase family protein [Vicinamibacterales bacterium]|nr:CaiB/BaiF CoA-transferase family protein [Vicinamibacterales bacterium]